MAELAARTRNPVYLTALRKAADTGFTETGEMKESMPYHDEMSDSLFMATAILARTGTLTGARRYFDMAARHGTKGIALSGFGQDDDLRRSRDAGFATHLTKPVNVQMLQQVIRTVAG